MVTYDYCNQTTDGWGFIVHLLQILRTCKETYKQNEVGETWKIAQNAHCLISFIMDDQRAIYSFGGFYLTEKWSS